VGAGETVAVENQSCRACDRSRSPFDVPHNFVTSVGSTARAYRAIDEYVEERVRHFLRRRHKVSSQGTREFSMKRIYGEMGIFRLRGPLRAVGS
jgi:hypothetical protein